MSAQQSAVWWSHGYCGLIGYLGHGKDGLEWARHDGLCRPGFWRVAVTGWSMRCDAVVDDFGNLVQVRSGSAS